MMSTTNVTVSSGELHLMLCWKKENKSHEKTHFHVQMSAEFKLLNRVYRQQPESSVSCLSFDLSFLSDNSDILRDEGKRIKLLNTFFYLLSSDTEISMQYLPGK